MKMKAKISTPKAFLKITCGFTLLSFATARMARKPYCPSGMIMAFIGAMKVGEGILRFCPYTYMEQHHKGGKKRCCCHRHHRFHH